jgi:hypothetical protein
MWEPSLARGRVCNFPAQLGVSAGPKSHRTCDWNLLSRLRPPPFPTKKARTLHLYLQRQGDPVIPPGTGFPFCSLSYPHTAHFPQAHLTLNYGWRPVGQSILVSNPFLVPVTIYFLFFSWYEHYLILKCGALSDDKAGLSVALQWIFRSGRSGLRTTIFGLIGDWPSYTSGHCFLSVASINSQVLRWCYSTLPPHTW